MKSLYALVLSVIFILAPTLTHGMEDGVAAVVNQSIITQADVLGQVRLALRQYKGEPKNMVLFRHKILLNMVENELKKSYALSQGVNVTQADIDQGILTLAKTNGLTPKAFAKVIKGLEKPMNDLVGREILWQKTISTRILPSIEVSTLEVDRMITNLLSKEAIVEREISQILVPTTAENAEEDVKNITDQLKEGTDFAKAALTYKEGGNAKEGGYLGWFSKGEFNADIEKALENKPTGEVIGPIKTSSGWHFIKIHRQKTTPTVQVRPIEKVRLYSITLTEGTASTLSKLLKKYPTLDTLKQQKNITVLDKNWQEIQQLSTQERALLPAKMGFGKIAKGEGAPRVLYVANRKKDMPENLMAIRKRVETRLKQNKLLMVERRLLRELKQRAFVDIR